MTREAPGPKRAIASSIFIVFRFTQRRALRTHQKAIASTFLAFSVASASKP
jgi:hypothetical protein